MSDTTKKLRADKRRRDLAMQVAQHAGGVASLEVIEAVLQAARHAGFRLIDSDRIVYTQQLKALFDTPANRMKPEAVEGLRREIALDMGCHLLEEGAIEFEEVDNKVRGHLYVIYPKARRPETRDEKS